MVGNCWKEWMSKSVTIFYTLFFPNRFTCMGFLSFERAACLGRMIVALSPIYLPLVFYLSPTVSQYAVGVLGRCLLPVSNSLSLTCLPLGAFGCLGRMILHLSRVCFPFISHYIVSSFGAFSRCCGCLGLVGGPIIPQTQTVRLKRATSLGRNNFLCNHITCPSLVSHFILVCAGIVTQNMFFLSWSLLTLNCLLFLSLCCPWDRRISLALPLVPPLCHFCLCASLFAPMVSYGLMAGSKSANYVCSFCLGQRWYNFIFFKDIEI